MLPSGHVFSEVPGAEIPRASFTRSHEHKTTFNSGYLVPVYVDEVLPGDVFNVSANFFARLATPLTPFMDNLYFDTFWFYTPNRILWANWEKFLGAQDNPTDSTDFLLPQMSACLPQVGDLADYFGLPTEGTTLTATHTIQFTSLPFRAYLLTIDTWFRNENTQDSLFPTVGTGDGPDTYSDFPLTKRVRRPDYFTRALPWPQKGPAVQLPLGAYAPVGNLANNEAEGGAGYIYQTQDFEAAGVTPLFIPANPGTSNYPDMPNDPIGTPLGTWSVATTSSGEVDTGGTYDLKNTTGVFSTSGPINLGLGVRFGALTADLSTATASNINQIRLAFQLQKMYERDARGGTRIKEIIRSHFGVTPKDERVQWPEFLAASTAPIKINPVVQTSGTGATGETTPQGNLAAYGVFGSGSQGFTKSFFEHGYIMCLVNVRADVTYQQGMNRMWSRQTRTDFYWPSLAMIGEQAILNKEIYCVGTANTAQDENVFGYQERWAEYRYYPSLVTGQFRSTYSTPLDSWHLALHFTSLPTLATLMPDTPPIQRVVAVESPYPEFILDSFFNVNTARRMPLFSVPGLIDHF